MYHEKLKSSKRRASKPYNEVSKGPGPETKPVPSPLFTPETIKRALWLGAILAVTLCAYSNSLRAPFLMDNNQAILSDPRIRVATSSNLASIFNQPYTPLSGLYRPLTTLSYLFNYAILGNAASQTGYHWFNLMLHGVNIALVYGLGLAIFEQLPVAVLLTAIWSLHPIQTEAVTNIVGRADMLAACAVLAALLLHMRVLRSTGRRKAAWLAALALTMTAGMFSKESAIVALAVIPLYDLTFGRAASWRSRVPGYIALAAPVLLFLIVRASVLANAPATSFPYVDNPLIGAGFWAARLTALKVIGKYLLLLVWPARLSPDYSYNAIPVFDWNFAAWEVWKTFVSLMACLTAIALAIVSYRRNKPLFFFILLFFVTLAPVSNIFLVIGSIMGERFLYLPSVAFAACVAYAIYATAQRVPPNGNFRYAGAATLTAMLIACTARTYARNNDWADAERFWNSAAQAVPGSFKPHLALAKITTLLPTKNWSRAAAEEDRTLAILDPLPPVDNVGLAYRDAGGIYRLVGDASTADPAVNPLRGSDPLYWYRKSLAALLRSEKIELAKDERDALSNARRGVRWFTAVPSDLYLEMGLTYARLHDPIRALAAFERGRALDPNPDLLKNLADAYLTAGDRGKAAAALVEAVVADPARSDLSAQALDVYAQLDPQGCAIVRNGGQRSLNLQCPLVHSDICAASRNVMAGYARAGKSFEFEATRRSAMEDLRCAPELLK